MKRLRIDVIAVIILLSSLVYGCSSVSIDSSATNTSNSIISQTADNSAGKNDKLEFDSYSDQVSFVKTVGIFPSMVSSDNGYYFFCGMRNGFVYYTDKAAMKTVALCNKPDCLHDAETDSWKKENCNAYLRAGNTKKNGDILYYGSCLYFLREKKEMGVPRQYFFTEMSLDGTQRKDVFEFKTEPKYIIIHRGYVYYTTTDNGTVSGQEDSTKTKSAVYRISLRNPYETPELVYENIGIYAFTANLQGYSDRIYFQCQSYPDPKMQILNSYLMCYNMISGESSVIGDTAGRTAICGNKIVCFIDGETKYICDLDGSNKKVLKNILGYPNCDDRYLLSETITQSSEGVKDKQGNPINMCLRVYDLDGKELQCFDLGKFNYAAVLGSDSSFIFLTTFAEGIDEYWRIDKNKISNRTAEMERFFRYMISSAS